MTEQTAEKKIEWMQAEINRLQNAQIRMLKISTRAVRQAEAEARQARQERDLCINQACTALKPLALLAVPTEGPIAHLNTGEEVTLHDIERAVRFVSRWRALMETEDQTDGLR